MTAGFSEESRLKGELEDLKRRLNVYEKSGYADVLKNFQKLRRQDRNVKDWEEIWSSAGEQLRTIADNIIPDFFEEFTSSAKTPIDVELQSHMASVHEKLSALSIQVKSLAKQADNVLSEWRKNKQGSSWKASVLSAEQAYQLLQENLIKEDNSSSFGYGELVQRRQLIEDQLETIASHKKEVMDLEDEIEKHLRDMILLRRSLTQSRRDFLEDVLDENQYIKIKVIPYGAKDSAEVEFREILQREKPIFSKEIGRPNGEGLL